MINNTLLDQQTGVLICPDAAVDATDRTQEFQVKDGTDLNDEENSPSQKWDGTEVSLDKRFPEEVFANLPPSLKSAVDFLVDDNEKEVFLAGALGVLSGMLPNVKGHYRGHMIESNLYTFLIAAFGEGKSSLEYARSLAMPIHRQKKEEAETLRKQYAQALAQYNKDLKEFEKGMKDIAPLKPASPGILKHFLASNSSKTGVLQLLYENGGRATLFETEGDTLADTLRQEYGNFSDLLRNAYHHQGVSYFRRSTGEDVEIDYPCLSVVLSSTFNQLVSLIPSAQNGLFSRFLYYLVPSNPVFDNVFNSRKREYNDFFNQLGEKYLDLYNQLNSLSTPIYFELEEHQQERFLELFQGVKDEVNDNISNGLGGAVNRLGIMCFRIAMILSTLREFDSGEIAPTIICKDVDFENAILLIETLQKHMLSVYWKLHKPNELEAKESNQDFTKEDQRRQCKELYLDRINKGFKPNYREIALQVLGSSSRHQTAYRWIHG